MNEDDMHLAAALERLALGRLTTTGDGTVLHMDAVAQRLLGQCGGGVRGFDVTELCAGEAGAGWSQMLRRARSGPGPVRGTIGCRVEGRDRWLEADVAWMGDGDGEPLLWLLRDVTDRVDAERDLRASSQLLRRLVEAHELDDAMEAALAYLRDLASAEAVALRLRDGDDYPYFATLGFPESFVAQESPLVSRDAEGVVLCDRSGEPILECLCGRVIRGRLEGVIAHTSDAGSFWTNSTTELLAGLGRSLGPIRAHCNRSGYESVALIPLVRDGTVVGLIQLNDSQRDRFTPELILLLEELGDHVAAALD